LVPRAGKHAVGALVDLFIAATAVAAGLPLYTRIRTALRACPRCSTLSQSKGSPPSRVQD